MSEKLIKQIDGVLVEEKKKKNVYHIKGITNATSNQKFPCELKRMNVWISNYNAITGKNTSGNKNRWIFINLNTGKNHFYNTTAVGAGGEFSKNNTFATKKEALDEIKRRGDIQ